jgi:hypothetical protein
VSSGSPPRATTALLLDSFALVLAALALLIGYTGGFHGVVAGITMSAQNAWRPAVLSLALVVFRLLIVPRIPFRTWAIRCSRCGARGGCSSSFTGIRAGCSTRTSSTRNR